MNTQKRFSRLLGLLLFIVLAGGGLFLYTEKVSEEIPEVIIAPESTQDKTPKNSYFEENGISFILISEYPDSQKYKLPLTIKGSVTDRTKWNIFEGQAGVVEIYGIVNGINTKIASSPITLNDSTYSNGSSGLNFDLMVGDRQWMSSLGNENGYLLLTEAGAKDNEELDYIKVPIILDISKEQELMPLILYIQDKEAARISDCRITKKITYNVPKTLAVADTSLRILFGDELSRYAIHDSVTITDGVAKIMLESDMGPTGKPISALSSCESGHLLSVLNDTLTQYDSITSVELYSPSGRIEF